MHRQLSTSPLFPTCQFHGLLLRVKLGLLSQASFLLLQKLLEHICEKNNYCATSDVGQEKDRFKFSAGHFLGRTEPKVHDGLGLRLSTPAHATTHQLRTVFCHAFLTWDQFFQQLRCGLMPDSFHLGHRVDPRVLLSPHPCTRTPPLHAIASRTCVFGV